MQAIYNLVVATALKRKVSFSRLHPLGISPMFVYRSLKLCDDTGDKNDHEKFGRPRNVLI